MVEKTLMGKSYWLPFKPLENMPELVSNENEEEKKQAPEDMIKPVSNSNEEEKKQAPVAPKQTPEQAMTPTPPSIPSEWTEVQGCDIAGEGDVE